MDGVQQIPRNTVNVNSESHMKDGNIIWWAMCTGFIGTFIVRKYVTKFCIPKHLQESEDYSKKWKWKNELTSLTHSLVSSTLAICAFICDPTLVMPINLINGLITKSSWLTTSVVSITMGYSLYDTIDIYQYRKNHKKSSKQIWLALHHAWVILPCALSLYTKRLIAYCAFALLCEVNSIFIHLRCMGLVFGVSKNGRIFKFLSIMNIITYAVFRLLLILLLAKFWILEFENIPYLERSVHLPIFVAMCLLNFVYFFQFLCIEFLKVKFKPY